MENYTAKEIEQLAATLAHEVKNPVSLIKANIDYLELTEKNGDYGKNLMVMKKELKKILDIVTDFIEYIKPTKESELETVFLYDLIQDILDEYDISIKSKSIEFKIDNSNEDISLNGNYSKLCILFFNIVKNAVEAIEEKGIINIHMYTKDNNIIIDVVDDGVGLDSTNSNNIYEPFFTTKKTGSGLGLSICKNIAHEHNGEFNLISNKNKGCTARVTFKSAICIAGN